MSPIGPQHSEPSDVVAPRSYRTLRRLTWLYTVAILMVGAVLSLALLPASVLPGTRALAVEGVTGGVGAIVASALLLAVTSLGAAVAMVAARYRHSDKSTLVPSAGRAPWLAGHFDPGNVARVGQAVIVTTGAVLVCVSAAILWPAPGPLMAPGSANVVASFVFALAFVSLIAERTMAAFPSAQLPEAPALRRILLLVTLLFLAAACVELGRIASFGWIRWIAIALVCLPCAVAIELAIRALSRMFLPAPPAAAATAVSNSIFASLLTGGPRATSALLRTHLGLDFTRNWALSFLSAALLPAILATALFCWGLSGVKLIDLGQRGVYERFGAPIEVLGPGLHVLLPWPLGRLRSVEYGAIHSVAIGVDQAQMGPEAAVAAEAPPPASLNRLWESAHAGQANYLVPSPSTGQQGFQTVSTEISVLYRVGLTDAQALDSVYTVAQPEDLVKEAASRLVLRYFNSRTLEAVLGARRESIADSLREALVADLNSYHAGIDVVSVLIEEIHPPAGAAAAYHAVQAAQINASASISNEAGRAKRTAGIAQQESHQLTAAAAAASAEAVHTASAEAYRFNADRKAYSEGGRSFLLERNFSNLERALGQTSLTIVDHRLSAAQAPVIDMRGYPATSAIAPTSPNTNAIAAPPPSLAPAARPAGSGGRPAPLPLLPDLKGLE